MQEPACVIVRGSDNPFRAKKLIGPFRDRTTAVTYGLNRFAKIPWWIEDLEAPGYDDGF